jgi:hypothetical protein
MVAAAHTIRFALVALLDSEAALGNTATVAGLASALTSLGKRAVQFIRAAVALQQRAAGGAAAAAAAAAAGNIHNAAVSDEGCFPAFVHAIVGAVFRAFVVVARVKGCFDPSSSSSPQAAASSVLLAVVLARSLVQLADTMEAAGPQLLYNSLVAAPLFRFWWAFGGPGANEFGATGLYGNQQLASKEMQWLLWQLRVLSAVQVLSQAMRLLGVPAAAAAATGSGGEAAEGIAAAAASSTTGQASTKASSSCGGGDKGSDITHGSSSSTSSQQVKWGYLLRLQQHSPQWTAAAAAFDAKCPACVQDCDFEVAETIMLLSSTQLQQLVQPYAEVLELCRALAAAAPLPVVCNNPSCENLAGVSEAAAACKACAGCKCRYCSEECQKADWKRHKYACRLMAAADEVCK